MKVERQFNRWSIKFRGLCLGLARGGMEVVWILRTLPISHDHNIGKISAKDNRNCWICGFGELGTLTDAVHPYS